MISNCQSNECYLFIFALEIFKITSAAGTNCLFCCGYNTDYSNARDAKRSSYIFLCSYISLCWQLYFGLIIWQMLWRFNFKLRQSISSERKVLHLLEYSELMKSFWMLYGHDMAWHGMVLRTTLSFVLSL